MAKPEEVAEKIAKKVAATLAPLEVEMDLMKWPQEFRTIMWNAVAHHASLRANEQGDS
jgi:hypothetical protein